MRNQWCLELHFIFVTIFFFLATTNTCLGARNTTVACDEHERLALLKFKHSLGEADGGMLSSWVGSDCCHWKRVVCNNVTGNIERLHLEDVSGLFSYGKDLNALGELRHLKYLDLSRNNFQESKGIPKFISTLKELTYLNLSDSCFSGNIPFNFGNLSSLKILDLHSHVCPWLEAHDMSWTSGLSSLEYLDLSGVDLSKAKNLDMVLYMIPSLKVLGLSGCHITNANLGRHRNSTTKLPNLKHLDLGYNRFDGQDRLPHFLQNMSSVQFLNLASFPFNLASNFANLLIMFPSLLELHLRGCDMQNETHLSHILSNYTTLSSIQHLDLSYNNLTGPIPETLKKLKLLQVLDLSGNGLTGPILTFPENLTELYLSFNYLNGSIPKSLRKVKLLQVLDLHQNELTGPIPTFPEKLKKLDLSGNYLTSGPALLQYGLGSCLGPHHQEGPQNFEIRVSRLEFQIPHIRFIKQLHGVTKVVENYKHSWAGSIGKI